MTEWYGFPNVKFTKIFNFLSVVEAYGLIYPPPLGKNSSFAWTCHSVHVIHLSRILEQYLYALPKSHISSLPAVIFISSYRAFIWHSIEMKTRAHDMNLPLQSDARLKHDIECFTEYPTLYTWHRPRNLIENWAHE